MSGRSTSREMRFNDYGTNDVGIINPAGERGDVWLHALHPGEFDALTMQSFDDVVWVTRFS